MPQYSFLKPFGCACFPNFEATFTKKLQPQSFECVHSSRNVQFLAMLSYPTLITLAPHSSRISQFVHRDTLRLTLTQPFVVLTEIHDPAIAHPQDLAPVTNMSPPMSHAREVPSPDVGLRANLGSPCSSPLLVSPPTISRGLSTAMSFPASESSPIPPCHPHLFRHPCCLPSLLPLLCPMLTRCRLILNRALSNLESFCLSHFRLMRVSPLLFSRRQNTLI